MKNENENEYVKLESNGFMQRAEVFLSNPRTLVAFTMGFLVSVLTTQEPVFYIFALFMTVSFAYRATDAVIAEIRAR